MRPDELESLGLSKAQSIIYLTLLKTGPTKIGRIIEETNLQSSVVHNNVNKLIEKGIVSFVLYGKVKHYNACKPEALEVLIKDEEEILKEKRKRLADILPQLKVMKKERRDQEVEVYKGQRGLRTAFEEAYSKCKQGSEVKFISMPSEYHGDEKLQAFFRKTNSELIRKGCVFKGIGHESLKKIWPKVYREKNYMFRYTEDDFPFDINILPESILISLWGKQPIVIRITDREFLRQAERFFEDKWSIGARP